MACRGAKPRGRQEGVALLPPDIPSREPIMLNTKVAKPKLTTVTINKIDYGEFERVVKDFYGKDFSVVAAEEWNNDSIHNFIVTGLLSAHDEKDLAEFKARGWKMYVTDVLVNDLCRVGLLPKGQLVIEVSW